MGYYKVSAVIDEWLYKGKETGVSVVNWNFAEEKCEKQSSGDCRKGSDVFPCQLLVKLDNCGKSVKKSVGMTLGKCELGGLFAPKLAVPGFRLLLIMGNYVRGNPHCSM